ncbi:MAG: glutaminase A [Alkalinema sp. CAN_BIN05]|nr:glutaminase A [Alkalinema sp. CAN_BIN05]
MFNFSINPIDLELLTQLHDRYKNCRSGTVASYIPELAKMNPDAFSICIATVDGEMLSVGDDRQLFTIQSISKVFTYGMALEDRGRDMLLSKVGVEPTGDLFNSIIRLDENSKRPDNPMVNAGAIATTNLIQGDTTTDGLGPTATDRLNRILNAFRAYAGRDLYVDSAVFMSERATGHRNRALAHLMRHFEMMDDRIDETLDLYFQQCALLVDCRDLALMAATLANNGINPRSGVRAIESEYVRDLLSVMYTCGMYNFAGEWAYQVGLPGKSGVSGGIIAVVPGKMGIAVFSPPLDVHGNSVRGVKVCEDLSNICKLHLFDRC